MLSEVGKVKTESGYHTSSSTSSQGKCLAILSEFLDSYGFEECGFIFLYLILDKLITGPVFKEHYRYLKKKKTIGEDTTQRKEGRKSLPLLPLRKRMRGGRQGRGIDRLLGELLCARN